MDITMTIQEKREVMLTDLLAEREAARLMPGQEWWEAILTAKIDDLKSIMGLDK